MAQWHRNWNGVKHLYTDLYFKISEINDFPTDGGLEKMQKW